MAPPTSEQSQKRMSTLYYVLQVPMLDMFTKFHPISYRDTNRQTDRQTNYEKNCRVKTWNSVWSIISGCDL